MSNDSNRQQSKAEPRWQSITSLVLGIISILPGVSILIYFRAPTESGWRSIAEIIAYPVVFSPYWGWLFPAVGFFLGVMGLKYTKKILAIMGIVLSLIGFVAYTFVYVILLKMGQL
jgi:heme O synthase-like polyprenyltransferase